MEGSEAKRSASPAVVLILFYGPFCTRILFVHHVQVSRDYSGQVYRPSFYFLSLGDLWRRAIVSRQYYRAFFRAQDRKSCDTSLRLLPRGPRPHHMLGLDTPWRLLATMGELFLDDVLVSG